MKISIIGFSGSGKSTLAKFFNDKLNLPLLYLDCVQFEENWKERDLDQKLKIVNDFLNENNSWVIDGNYSNLYQKERFEQADYIIFMKFNPINCLYRAYKRYFKYKNKARESITNGCNEKIDFEFFKWILFDGRNKARIQKFANIQNQYKDKFIIIKNQKELNHLMNNYKTIFKK